MVPQRHVLITGGAGYLGSYLVGKLLLKGYKVTVVDDLLFGGEALLANFSHPNFHFFKSDIWESRTLKAALKTDWPLPGAVIHLAALAGFPACQAVGEQVAWRYNVEATRRVFEQSDELQIPRFIFSSTYSNYGRSSSGGKVSEETPLNPQSLYAETKAASEDFLLEQANAVPAPLIFRLSTVYGISPRPRFDVIVNQFVWEAFRKHQLMIYQRGYSRSFVHIDDAARGLMLGLEAPQAKVRGEVFNLGSPEGNLTKDQVVALILKRLPETEVRYKDITFGGDMRDLSVSFEKIYRELGFQARKTVDDGIREVLTAIQEGIITDPAHRNYRNARFIVQ
jgi:nucleoside-diphosphate-sugar epimerase